MQHLRKYLYLPNAVKLGVLAITVATGCFSGCNKDRTDLLVEMDVENAFSIEPVVKEIHTLDSLWEAGNVTQMEGGFQQLLQREHEWAGKLDAKEYAWLYDWIGEFHYRLGDLTDAQQYNELAMSRLDSIDNLDFKTDIWNNRALIESDLGNYETALELLFRSMNAYGTDTVNASFINFYNNIGSVYAASKNNDLAIHYFEKLMELAKRLGLEEEFGYYHGNIGYTYYTMGQYKRSISHLERARASFIEYQQFKDELLVNTALASNYVALGQLENAERLLTGNLEMAEKRQLWEVYVETTISLFEFYIAKGNERLAFAAIERGLEKIHVTNTARLQLKLYRRLVDHYRQVGDFRNAFTYLRRRISIRDSAINASQAELMRELSVKYEADRKSDQIARLHLMNTQERRTKAIYFAGLVLLALVLLLVFVLLRRISIQKRILEETNRTKDRLFSIIAHDLRSPMIALRGMGDLLNHYIDKEDERGLSDLAGKTGKTLTHINHLLDNLLNWAVANSDRISYNPVAQEVSSLVEEAVSVYKTAAEAKQLKLVSELMPGDVVVDLNMASSILRNVISNAIKYSPIRGTVTITGVLRDDYYVISIKDEGTGVPEEIISRLQSGREATVSGGGKESFGLGLQLAMYFAKENHGKLVVSNSDQGALVEIWLPLKRITLLSG